jgi:transcription initiation factor TFIID subunit 12
MRNIALLTEDEKVKYERGLLQLWTLHDSKPLGSPENLDAKKKLVDFGKMLQSKVSQRRQQMANQQRAQQLGQQQNQQQGQQQPQQTQQNPNAQSQPGNQQGPQAGTQGGPAAGNAQQGAQGQPAAPNAPHLQGALPQPKIPDHIMSHVNQVPFQAPANVQDKGKWVHDMKMRYTKALLTMESSRANIARIDHMIKERADKGNPCSPEELATLKERKEQMQKSHGEAHTYVERVRQQMGFQKNAQQQQNGAGQKPGPNQQQQTPRMQGAGQPNGGAAAGAGVPNPMQSSAATVNAAIEAAKNQQLAAAGRMAGGQQQGQQGQQAGQQLPQSQILPPSAQQPQVLQSPVTHQAPPPPGQTQTQQSQIQTQSAQQQPHIKLEPGTTPQSQPPPHIPAPLNTAIASAAAVGGLPSAGTPTQNSARALQTPQTSTPTTGQPRPLTHTAALSLANQGRTGSIGLPGQPQQPGGATGTPTQSTPGTGSGVIGAAQLQHQQPQPHHAQQPGQGAGHINQQQHGVQPSQPGSLQSKLPIPKVLPEKATAVPTPVAGNMGGIGSGRPTFSGGSGIGGGVMGQPALAKTPAFQLEGEGDRVLNKKKLDELVRQVCGGTAEGDEGNLLSPDVEEVCFPLSFLF